MKGPTRKQHFPPPLRTAPELGTQLIPHKNQGYQLPLHLWQDLVDEAARRRKLGLSHASQNAIAVAAITAWLESNKGMS
jgi:hypothetical protein